MGQYFGSGKLTNEDAKLEAQKLAFAPFAFQAARILRDRGILKIIEESGERGIERSVLNKRIDMNEYGIYVLLDAGESIGIVEKIDERWRLTKTGYFILNDRITIVNMDFTQDVCYQGAFYLEESIDNSCPEGLKVFGSWNTVYEALSKLPEKVRKSWFSFDHYFSDSTFPKALAVVLGDSPKKLLDIGGNTGKWALKCVNYNSDVKVTILDLPGQVNEALVNIKDANMENRVDCVPINLLDHTKIFPTGYDAVWMSQFLDCFPPEDIISILQRAKDAINNDGIIYIMETFVDKQKYPISKYCLDMTSLYFTAIANGKSRMYHCDDMVKFVEIAGMKVVDVIEKIGISHSILKIKK